MPPSFDQDPVLMAFLKGIAGVRSRIQQMILFGSRARGEEKPYSDYDVLLVVQEREKDLMAAVYDAVMDTLLETSRLVSPKVFRRRDFDRSAAVPMPFLQNVLREGIPLGLDD